MLGSAKWNAAAPGMKTRPAGKKLFFSQKWECWGQGWAGKSSGHPACCLCWRSFLSITISCPTPQPSLSHGEVVAGDAASLAAGRAGRWVTAGPQLLSCPCPLLSPATACFAQAWNELLPPCWFLTCLLAGLHYKSHKYKLTVEMHRASHNERGPCYSIRRQIK